MSRFLGPIHYWLFNKIKLYEELEAQIINNIHGQLDLEITVESENFNQKIGNPIPHKPLEELIDTNDIHGWLQNKISVAETRQAAIITHIINKYENKGMELIKEAYKQHGVDCGKDAQAQYDVTSAPELYKALNNFILDGMPCDNVNNITINQEDRLQWKVLNCLHKGYWMNVNGDIDVLYELREIWISNFISNANPSFAYTFNIVEMNDRSVLVHEIKK